MRAVPVTVDGVDDGDRLLDLRALDVVESESGLVNSVVEVLFAEVLRPPDFGESRLEIVWHGCFVGDGAGQIVDIDIRAEHVAGIAIDARDRCACERDEHRAGHGVADVPGEAVEVVVVAAVRFVDDGDDVAPVGEQWVVGTGITFPAG